MSPRLPPWLLLLPLLMVPLRASAQDLARIQQSGRLVMLAFPHQQNPFIRVNLAKGAMVKAGSSEYFEGFDVDMMVGFAKRLGVELEIRPVSEPRYGALIPDLLAGRGDLIASSLTITEERRQHVSFSRPYFRIYPVLLCRAGEKRIHSVDDLRDRIGAVMTGSSHEERLLHLGMKPEMLRRYDFSIEAYGAVSEGEADYVLADSSAFAAMKGSTDLEIAFRLPEENFFGVAVPLGSDLLPELDAYLLELEEQGELDKLLHRYFSSLPN